MSVPLKAKVAIRDHWSSDDCKASKAVAGLRAVLGRDIHLEPEWPMLLAELDSVYTDKTDLVVSVASTVQVWCRALTELLEDETNETWGEELLEKLAEGRSFALRVNVEVAKDSSPSTAWEVSRGGFIIYLSNNKSRPGATDYIPLFKSQLLNVFKPQPAHTSVAAKAAAKEDEDDDFALIAGDKPVIIPSHTAAAAAAPAAGTSATIAPIPASVAGIVVKDVAYVPDSSSLPRPDELLTQPPYHMFIHARGYEITIQCSHSPSLELLDKYLRKWCRQNNVRHNKPPMVTITLHQSPFGLGLVYDTLRLESEHTYTGAPTLSAAIVLNLVEALLGYRPVHSDMGGWHYRKDTPLKL